MPCCTIHVDKNRSELAELAIFLRALSERYTAQQDLNNESKFHIFAPLRIGRITVTWEVFELEVFPEAKTEKYRLKMRSDPPPRAIVPCLYDDYCRKGNPDKGRKCEFCLQFMPSVIFGDTPNTDHPFDVFRTYVQNHIRYDPAEPDGEGVANSGELRRLFNYLFPNLAASFVQMAAKGRWRSDLAKVLAELTGGTVHVTYTTVYNSHLRPFGLGRYLFCLTCVLPWAVDILVKRPNCLMTDSTFKCVKPYTLPILHAIIANESIPMAFGISPTETADSYGRIYEHIIEHNIGIVPPVLEPVVLSPSAVRPKFAPDPGTKAWKDDPASVNDGDHRPGEEVYLGTVKEQNASPMTAAPAFRNLRGLLCSIPILTDQGTALRRFINHYGLTWFVCHRHIIESLGASTAIGGWGARLLRTFSESEWMREVEVVTGEIATKNKRMVSEGRRVPDAAVFARRP
jgi:hypothetical protein